MTSEIIKNRSDDFRSIYKIFNPCMLGPIFYYEFKISFKKFPYPHACNLKVLLFKRMHCLYYIVFAHTNS